MMSAFCSHSWLLYCGYLLASLVLLAKADGSFMLNDLNGIASHASRKLQDTYSSDVGDDATQHQALMAFYQATQGAAWDLGPAFPPTLGAWGTTGLSYCRWYGVTCCASSPLDWVPCTNARDIVMLRLDGFGLNGTLVDLSALPALTVLDLSTNPNLDGALPATFGQPQLLWTSVKGTKLSACTDAATVAAGTCSLPASLLASTTRVTTTTSNQQVLTCSALRLASFDAYMVGKNASLAAHLTWPFDQPDGPGLVAADPVFSNYLGCECAIDGAAPHVGASGPTCVGGSSVSSSDGGVDRQHFIIAMVLVAVLPQLLVAFGIYMFIRHRHWLARVTKQKDKEMQKKRSRFPGTPSIALQNGRGVLTMTDVLVTWVYTDIEGSTLLWEWNSEVMVKAVDQHNAVLRGLLEEFGGHEIRTDGDSFTLAFHDAVDAVKWCLKAQEQLLLVEWPEKLYEHEYCAKVTVGDLCGESTKGMGDKVMSGLRVRMGINTGIPDDIFVHDMTEHVDYRGAEYDLAGDICDMAAGGQILMGPKTFQRWNKVYGQVEGESQGGATDGLDPNASQPLLNSPTTMGNGSFTRAPFGAQRNSGAWNKSSTGGQRPNGDLLGLDREALELNLLKGQGSADMKSGDTTPRIRPLNQHRSSGISFAVKAGQNTSVDIKQHSKPQLGRARSFDTGTTLPERGTPQPVEDAERLRHERAQSFTADNRSGAHGDEPSRSVASVLHALAGSGRDSVQEGSELIPAHHGIGGEDGTLGEPHATQEDAWKQRPRFSRLAQGSCSGAQDTPMPPIPSSLNSPQQQHQQHLHSMEPSELVLHRSPPSLISNRRTGNSIDSRPGSALSPRLPNSMAAGRNSELFAELRGRSLSSFTVIRDRAGGALSAIKTRMMRGLHTLAGGPGGKGDASDASHRGTVGGAADVKQQTIVIDMGYYQFKEAHPLNPEGGAECLHLVQAVSATLAPRLRLFPWPLPASEGSDAMLEKIMPGFFDAPGGRTLHFPMMKPLLDLGGSMQRPDISLVFINIGGYKDVLAYNSEVAQFSMQLYTACVRETLSACGGYESKEVAGLFLATFNTPAAAVEWAITLQLALVQVPWPEELLLCPAAAEVLDDDPVATADKDAAEHATANSAGGNGGAGPDREARAAAAVLRGLRVKVGIFNGPIDRVLPHHKSGRADYLGAPANRAARMMAAAYGGQILCEASMMEQVLAQWNRPPMMGSKRSSTSGASVDGGSPASPRIRMAMTDVAGHGSRASTAGGGHSSGGTHASEMRTARSFLPAALTPGRVGPALNNNYTPLNHSMGRLAARPSNSGAESDAGSGISDATHGGVPATKRAPGSIRRNSMLVAATMHEADALRLPPARFQKPSIEVSGLESPALSRAATGSFASMTAASAIATAPSAGGSGRGSTTELSPSPQVRAPRARRNSALAGPFSPTAFTTPVDSDSSGGGHLPDYYSANRRRPGAVVVIPGMSEGTDAMGNVTVSHTAYIPRSKSRRTSTMVPGGAPRCSLDGDPRAVMGSRRTSMDVKPTMWEEQGAAAAANRAWGRIGSGRADTPNSSGRLVKFAEAGSSVPETTQQEESTQLSPPVSPRRRSPQLSPPLSPRRQQGSLATLQEQAPPQSPPVSPRRQPHQLSWLSQSRKRLTSSSSSSNSGSEAAASVDSIVLQTDAINRGLRSNHSGISANAAASSNGGVSADEETPRISKDHDGAAQQPPRLQSAGRSSSWSGGNTAQAGAWAIASPETTPPEFVDLSSVHELRVSRESAHDMQSTMGSTQSAPAGSGAMRHSSSGRVSRDSSSGGALSPVRLMQEAKSSPGVMRATAGGPEVRERRARRMSALPLMATPGGSTPGAPDLAGAAPRARARRMSVFVQAPSLSLDSSGGSSMRRRASLDEIRPGGGFNSASTSGAGGGSGGADATAGDAADGDAAADPAVIAQCFKIRPQNAGTDDPAQSITMIKYTNLQFQDAANAEEQNERATLAVPITSTLVTTVATDVVVYSLGTFRLKGVENLVSVVQVFPACLEKRLQHLPQDALNKGKARCVQMHVAKIGSANVRLPDVTQLSCCQPIDYDALRYGDEDADEEAYYQEQLQQQQHRQRLSQEEDEPDSQIMAVPTQRLLAGAGGQLSIRRAGSPDTLVQSHGGSSNLDVVAHGPAGPAHAPRPFSSGGGLRPLRLPSSSGVDVSLDSPGSFGGDSFLPMPPPQMPAGPSDAQLADDLHAGDDEAPRDLSFAYAVPANGATAAPRAPAAVMDDDDVSFST